MKPIGWDLEIAGEFPEGDGDRDWLTIEPPLGVSCTAAAEPQEGQEGEVRATTFTPFGVVGDRLVKEEARLMARWLYECQEAGAKIVTWNGLGFDFPVLARECGDGYYTHLLAQVALDHIDMAFTMFCQKGFMVGLQTAAEAFNLHGKLDGMNGALAPILWNPPDRDLTDKELIDLHNLGVEPGTPKARHLCLDYVRQDAVTTLELYQALMDKRQMVWRTRRGTPSRYPWVPYVVDGHIGTCRQALRLEAPDTSWMSDPRSRSDYAGWALDALNLDMLSV
jgi:hypothetical protein